MKKMFLAIVVLVLVVVGLWYVIAANRKDIGDVQAPQTTQKTVESKEVPMDDVKIDNLKKREIEIKTDKRGFVPNEISAKKNDLLTITFESISGSHDLVIEEFAVATNLLADGESESVEFVADRTGKFEFYSSVEGDREKGFVGYLTISE